MTDGSLGFPAGGGGITGRAAAKFRRRRKASPTSTMAARAVAMPVRMRLTEGPGGLEFSTSPCGGDVPSVVEEPAASSSSDKGRRRAAVASAEVTMASMAPAIAAVHR